MGTSLPILAALLMLVCPLLTACAGPKQAARAEAILVWIHQNRDPYSTRATEVATWAAATLWLGSRHSDVSHTDIQIANQRLDDLDDSTQFQQMPRNFSQFAPKYSLYWALPTLVRCLEDSKIVNRTTFSARQSLRNVLRDFVTYRDEYANGGTNPDDVFRIVDSYNHDWLRKSTFLLTAQHFKKLRGGDGWNIYEDGHTATEHYDRWRAHLKEKIHQMARRGLNPEVGSPGYASVTLQALFNLHDVTDDLQLANLVRKFITLYLADAGVESFAGIRGGGKVRVSKGDWAHNGKADMLHFWTYLLANTPSHWYKPPDRTVALAAMTNYALPGVARNLIRDWSERSFSYTSRRPARGNTCVGCYQGTPEYRMRFPQDMRRYTYVTPHYVLGGFGIDERQPAGHYMLIHAQNQWIGLVLAASPEYSRVYFQTRSPVGTNGYRDLTSICHKSACLVKRQELAAGNPPLFVYMSNDFRVARIGPSNTTENWIFSANSTGEVYVAIKASDAEDATFYTLHTDGPGHGEPLTVEFADNETIVALEVGLARDFANVDDFQSQVIATTFRQVNEEVEYVSLSGHSLVLYKDTRQAKLDGKRWGMNVHHTYHGEYIHTDSSASDSPLIHLRDPRGHKLTLDFNY